ncbi:MAG: hypothetical protein CL693_20120 [Cellvibrionaceae bacterium]|nr:hypothetical protein [Cellvibrionaceae bacterium]|tara:strand:+ start:395 stop:649 length:255 start_codon:yes stop_codon:yes gene_type:complete
MKIQSIKFGVACALSASLLWTACSVLVIVFPSMMLSMSGDMLHMDLMEMKWHLTTWGFVQGLMGWFIATGVGGWLIAAIYNRFI